MSAAAAREQASDVLIVGGGPAGSALARALALRGTRVALLEAGTAKQRQPGESLRAVARTMLAELALLHGLPVELHQPAFEMRSCWTDAVVRARASIADVHGPDMHLDRGGFDRFMLSAARAAGASVYDRVAIDRVARDASDRSFRLEGTDGDGRTAFRTRVLIDATGRKAWVGKQLGASRLRPDALVAVCRWFRSDAVQPFTLVEAAPDGWFYSAPLPGRALFVLFMTAPGPSARSAACELGWSRCVAQAPQTAARLSHTASDGAAMVAAAGPALTNWDVPDFLPVGDAAFSFDPIAPDGLCFALRSALDASYVVERMLAGDDAPSREYRDGIRRLYEDHLRRREVYYGAVRQFPGSSFWAKRAPSAIFNRTPEV